jgi:hypothetical protein
MVPTFTWGFVLSYFFLAIVNLRFIFYGAHERDGTADLILTKDVLYRLSYMGTWSRQNFNPLRFLERAMFPSATFY